MATEVKTKVLENINDQKQYYLVVETKLGRVNISIGEKNFDKLQTILGEKPELPNLNAHE